MIIKGIRFVYIIYVDVFATTEILLEVEVPKTWRKIPKNGTAKMIVWSIYQRGKKSKFFPKRVCGQQ